MDAQPNNQMMAEIGKELQSGFRDAMSMLRSQISNLQISTAKITATGAVAIHAPGGIAGVGKAAREAVAPKQAKAAEAPKWLDVLPRQLSSAIRELMANFTGSLLPPLNIPDKPGYGTHGAATVSPQTTQGAAPGQGPTVDMPKPATGAPAATVPPRTTQAGTVKQATAVNIPKPPVVAKQMGVAAAAPARGVVGIVAPAGAVPPVRSPKIVPPASIPAPPVAAAAAGAAEGTSVLSGIGKLAGPVGLVAGVVVGLGAAAVSAVKGIKGMGDEALETAERLKNVSPAMAQVSAFTEMRDMLRDMKTGQAIGPGLMELARNQADFKDEYARTSAGFTNLWNKLLGKLISIATPILASLNKILTWLGLIEENTKKDDEELGLASDWLNKQFAQIRDEIEHKTRRFSDGIGVSPTRPGVRFGY